MPDRNFAAKAREQKADEPLPDFSIELSPRSEIKGLDGKKIAIKLKTGATESQSKELESMLNLLGVELKLTE